MSLRPTRFRRMLSIVLMLAVGGFYSMVTGSALAQSSVKSSGKSAGELSVSGSVTINGTSAISGATVFSESRIRTAANSSAVINLGRLGRLQLGPESEMTVRFNDGTLGGSLSAGRAVANAPAGVAVSILTADGVAAAGGGKSAAIAVDVTCGNTRVMAARSEATLTAAGRVETVNPGKEVSAGQAKGTCTRIATPTLGTGLSTGALASLIIAGIGGAVGGLIAATQSDNVAPSSVVVSGFRP